MKGSKVRKPRQRFHKAGAQPRRDETALVRKRKNVIGRIVPEPQRLQAYPDFAEIQKQIFGNQTMKRTFTELIREERDRF